MANWTKQDQEVSIWASTSPEDTIAYQDAGESYAYGDEGELLGTNVTLGAGTGPTLDLGLDDAA